MNKHVLIPKGEHIQALISTTQQPNLLIPVRAIVYDIKYDEVSPQYQIRIKRFYDNIQFLKQNLLGGRFIRDFEGGETRINAMRATYKSVDELTDNLFNGANWKKYLVVVDSVFCTKTLDEQMKLFNNLQTFMIELKLKEIYQLAMRPPYRQHGGEYAFSSKDEFKSAVSAFLGDRMPKDSEWLNSLLYDPTARELDRGEWV
jgi:hypothetical protein